MGQSFDRTDMETGPEESGWRAGSDPEWTKELESRTPLTFPFPLHMGDLPLDPPEADSGARKVG